MKRIRMTILVAAALAAVMVLGVAGVAVAAPTAAAKVGGQVGGVCRQAGASLADVVAKLTGQSAADVRTQRSAGKTFADIAKSKGVSAQQVTDEALKARKVALDAAVKAGTITQAQADFMYSRMKDRIPARITAAPPAGCDGTGSGAGCGGGGCGMGGGMGRSAGPGFGGVGRGAAATPAQ